MSEKQKNIYEKLQEMRCKLQDMKLKKTGQNKFANYKYYELSDFLPYINQLQTTYKVFSKVTFGEKAAVLTIINAENIEEKIIFASPMREANLKGAQPIQNLGGMETYQRRYLYITAYEIVENDALDAILGGNGDWTEADEQKKAIADAKKLKKEGIVPVNKVKADDNLTNNIYIKGNILRLDKYNFMVLGSDGVTEYKVSTNTKNKCNCTAYKTQGTCYHADICMLIGIAESKGIIDNYILEELIKDKQDLKLKLNELMKG